MEISTAEITNWMAFEGVHALTFPQGAIAVVARYKDNAKRSNWAGKTAFLEAIDWCFYGTHRKRYDDDVITWGTDGTEVQLGLSDGTIVRRRRNRGKSTVLEVVTVEGRKLRNKDAQKHLEMIIGFGSEDYRATVFFAQGDTEAIVGKTSSERRKTVGKWLDLDPWLRVAARGRAVAKAAADDLARFEPVGWATELVEKYRDRDFDKEIEAVQTKIQATREAVQEFDQVLEAEAEREIVRLDRLRFDRVMDEIKSLRTRLEGRGVPASEWANARDELAQTRMDERRVREEVDAAILLVRGDFDGVCPVTCEECPVVEDVRGNRTAANAKLQEARASLQRATSALKVAQARENELAVTEAETNRLRHAYNSTVAEARRLKESIEHRDRGGEAKTEEDLASIRNKRQEIRAELDQHIATARDLENAAERLQEARRAIQKRASMVETMERAARVAALARKAVGPTGVPSMIAEVALVDLEEHANVLLSGTGLSISFGWDRETKGLIPMCDSCGYTYKGNRDKECPACGEARGFKRSDELEILVDDGSEVEEVRTKSGGAKVLVASAIRLSAGLMLRERRGSRCGWAQVDEPFGALDAENRGTLARSFASMLGAVGLSQAFVVSHDSALLDALPARIEIVRDGDRSTIQVVQ